MNEYKQQIIDFYNGRDDYDNEFTRNRALSLVNLVPLKTGQTILDVATGTGFMAIEAAQKVGNQGKVIAVDFSPQMLSRCQAKISALGLANIEWRETDVDDLDFPENSFDGIFCSSAIALFSKITQVLNNWHNWLKSGGFLAFSTYSAESFFTPVIMKVCNQLGYNLPNINETLGTEEKCQKILEDIGYAEIRLKKKQLGQYLTVDAAQKWWKGNWLHPQYHPLLKINSQQREELQAKFSQEIAKLATEQGVWHESTLFLITGRKK
jgi:protein-L-isoaspartate(D-aspartate) O-methyltransferase